MKKTQKETILNFLSTGKNLSRRRAESWGIKRLAARVHELREEGYVIFTNMKKYKKTGEPYYAYRLSNNWEQYLG